MAGPALTGPARQAPDGQAPDGPAWLDGRLKVADGFRRRRGMTRPPGAAAGRDRRRSAPRC